MSETNTQSEHTATILFADICGSTPLFEGTGNWTAFRAISQTLDHHAEIITTGGGSVIRSKGDDLLCTFSSADEATAAAAKMLAAQADEDVQLRVGLHYGSFIRGRGDIFGDAVNVAARLMGLARPGEGIASAALSEQLGSRWRNELIPFAEKQLKGKSDTTALFRLLPPDDDTTEMVSVRTQIRAKTRPVPVEVELVYADQRVRLSQSEPSLSIGRADDSGMQVASRRVSRAHALIVVREGRVTLTDRSTLGTWIVSGQNELMVRRESVHLTGAGKICLGAHPSEQAPTTIHYTIEKKPGSH